MAEKTSLGMYVSLLRSYKASATLLFRARERTS